MTHTLHPDPPGGAAAEAERLAGQVARLRSVLASITEGYFALDAQFRFVEANRAACETIFRRPEAELIGRGFWELYPQGRDSEFFRRYHEAARTRRPDHFEAKSHIVDRWFEAHVYPREDRLEVYIRDITDRKRAEEALRESEARFRAMAETAPVMIWMADPDGGCTYLNRRWSEFTGLTLEEVGGRRWLEAVHPEDRERLEKIAGEAADRRGLLRLEYRLRRADGSYGWVLDSAAPRLSPSGELLGHIGSLVDLTDHRETELALRESESRFRGIFDNAAVGIALVETDGRWSQVNDRLCEMLGYRREELVALTFQEVTWPEDLEVDLERARSLLAGEIDTYSIEKRYVRKDGRPVWAQMTGSVLSRDAAGRAERFIAVVEDIDERKRAEGALQESETRFRTLTESIPLIVWLTDPDGQVLYRNPEFTRVTGLPAEVADETVQAAIHPDDWPRVERAWTAAVATSSRFEVELRFATPAGGYRWYLVRLLPLRGDEGEVRLWLGAGADVDDQKRAAEALREADRRKDEFLAMLAHELRNPLAPVLTGVQLLRRHGPADPLLERQRTIIERQVLHMKRLLDDLLDVSRITRGKIDLRLAPLDLRGAVEAAVDATESFVRQGRHRLELRLPPDAVPVEGDADRLVQVVTNLIGNAAKYTLEPGEIVVAVECDAGVARIVVRDPGVGLTPQEIAGAFELFTQGSSARVRDRAGLGVGLALVKAIVGLHGGGVEATSPGPGEGATFTVTLPLARRGPSPASDRAVAPLGIVRPARVLVVDDNVDAATSLAELLELAGHQVAVEHDGPAALERVAAFRPEAVLLDIGLPGMDGHEVARRLRGGPGGGDLRLAAITGYGRDEDRRRALDSGFDRHFVKPLDIAELESWLAGDAAEPGR